MCRTRVCRFLDICDTQTSAVGYTWGSCPSFLGHLGYSDFSCRVYKWFVSVDSGTYSDFSCRVYMGLVSVVPGTFGILWLQLSGVHGACVCNLGKFGIWGLQLSGLHGGCVGRFWTFGILGLQLSGVHGACVCRFIDI